MSGFTTIYGTYETWSDLRQDLGIHCFAYTLTGRFGNHLLGLSDAYRLHKQGHGRPVFLGLGESDVHRLTALNDSSWFLIFKGKIKTNLRQTDVHEWNTGRHHEQQSESKCIEDADGFFGFTRSYSLHEESGFLTKSISPFSVPKETNPPLLAISIRLGDYFGNPDLGVLPLRYFEKAIKALNLRNFPDTRIYTDSQQSVDLLKKSWIAQIGEIKCSTNPLLDWHEIRMAKYAVISNSTFAYTARLSRISTTIFPKPFYLSVKEKFVPDFAKTIRHTRFPYLRFIRLRITRQIRLTSGLPNAVPKN